MFEKARLSGALTFYYNEMTFSIWSSSWNIPQYTYTCITFGFYYYCFPKEILPAPEVNGQCFMKPL